MVILRSRNVFPVLGLVLALTAAPARAALECEAVTDRTTVPAGDRVALTVTVRGDFDRNPDVEAPEIEKVDIASGGTSQRYSFTPAGTEAELSVTYYLTVRRLDDFTIPALRVTARGTTCATTPIEIHVTDPTVAVPPGSSGNRSGSPSPPGVPTAGAQAVPEASGAQAGRPGDEIFITLEADKEEVWVGEQIILSFKYLRRVNPWDNPSYEPPRTEGFWRLDLPPERHYRQRLAGQNYQVTEIRYALFPTRSGDLVIGGAGLTFPDDPFERFFSRRRRGRSSLRTDDLAITVRELPQPRPVDFAGLVATELDLTASVDRDTVPRGEPISLQIQLRSDAFLKGFAGIDVTAPAGVRAHDSRDNLREDLGGAPRYRATLIQEKALVPLEEGRLDLAPLQLSYFNAARDRYETATAVISPIIVTGSDLPVLGDDPSGFRRTEIARLGNDLAFIHTADGPLVRRSAPWLERPLWWVLLLLPAMLLLIQRVYLRRLAADRRDPEGSRRRRALSRALQDCRRARKEADPAARLAAMQRAIRGYVADRTGRAAAGLTAADVRAFAATAGEESLGEALARVLDLADDLRFSGDRSENADPDQVLADVPSQLRRLERAVAGSPRRRKLPTETAVLAVLLGLAAAGNTHAQGDLAPAAGPRPGVDPARLLAEGNRAYTAGDVSAARASYELARALGADAAVLHYNLGNAYAREGQLGRAIASYLRAQRRDPRAGDIRTNLVWVRSHIRDLELGGGESPPVVAQLDRLSRLLSLDEWAWVTVVLTWLVGVLVAVSWWRGYLSDARRRGLLIAVALLVVALLQTGRLWYHHSIRDLAVVTAEEVEVRSGPATTFPVVFRIHDGLTLVIRGEREGWARIGLGGEWVGWVPDGVLERVQRSY